MRDLWEYKELGYTRNCDNCGAMAKIFAVKQFSEYCDEHLCIKCVIAELNAHESWDIVEEQRAMP